MSLTWKKVRSNNYDEDNKKYNYIYINNQVDTSKLSRSCFLIISLKMYKTPIQFNEDGIQNKNYNTVQFVKIKKRILISYVSVLILLF